jgi:hypothetical protein
MPIDPREFADILGAEIVGQVPDVVGGLFGMARLARLMHERLTPSRGERPGRPIHPNWVTRCKVPMSDATLSRLTKLAEAMSTGDRKVSPMQVAAQLLEEAVGRVGDRTSSVASETAVDTGTARQPAKKAAKSGRNRIGKKRTASRSVTDKSLDQPSSRKPA